MAVQPEKLQRMFESDSSIMLETLSSMLAAVSPGELGEADVDRAFRAAHSIKTEAGFLNVTDVATSAHRLEDALTKVRQAGNEVDEASAAHLQRGLRALQTAIAAYRGSRNTGHDRVASSPSVAKARTATAPSATPSSRDSQENEASGHGPSRRAISDDNAARMSAAERGMLREAKMRGEQLYRVAVLLRSPPETRYARAFLVVNNLELSSAVVRTDPPLDDIQRSSAERLTLLITASTDEEAIRRAVHVDEVELANLTELSFDEVMQETADQDGVDAAAYESGKGGALVVSADRQEEIALFADEIQGAALELQGSVGDDRKERLAERMRQIAGYASILRDRVGSSSRVQLLELARELKSSSITYAAGQGKRVRVIVGGQGALVANVVGDALLEALMHLIRNSIDHGIGTIEERARAGRHPAATIKIRVDRTGDRVRIVVQDDGRGIDEEAVRARAGDSDSPLLDVLARSGFSMRESADTNSGRGVGLDIVMHSVRTLLGGEIKLLNRPEAGMTFVISVPAAARLVHVFVAESGSTAYAIPSATVEDHRSLDRGRVKRDSFGALYYEYDGETLPLSTPAGRAPALRALGESSFVIVVRAGHERRALQVDTILGEEAVVREDARLRRVYSRVLGREAQFVFPPSLAGQDGPEDGRFGPG